HEHEPQQQRPPQTGHEQHTIASPDAQSVPGFPQDMWMPMDDMVADKPEVYGLRKDWTGAMMGMMTLVRVLPPDVFDKIMAMKQQKEGGR
ncbi:MAG: hypothetical protein HY646_05625, partial [Acidobacteria bacterium]|nr:hypothetical protein [Acidobacteriota bacterium]